VSYSTVLIFVLSDAFGRIGAKRSWNGQYTVPCDKVPSLPELTFYFGGKPYPLQGSDYILNAGGTCISAFTGMDINLPGGQLWIVGTHPSLSSLSSKADFHSLLGDVFLRKYFTVYDLERHAVGFALSA
jgi:saccharopepsin